MKPLFGKFDRVHLVGIGGVGMEGLARILRELGCRVSGSDRSSSPAVEQLHRERFEVHIGHRAAQVEGVDLIVYSAAVPIKSEELVEGRRRGIPVVGRAEVLGELSRSHFTIGVAGSHGKTTTASMVASILKQGVYEPSMLIGGWMKGRVQAELGAGEFFVVEADEFDRSFLSLYPCAALVTTIDAEHLDCYQNLEEVKEAFCQYLERLPFYGHCLLGGDDAGVQSVMGSVEREYFTYGLEAGNDFRAENIQRRSWSSCFDLFFRREYLGSIELGVPGEHNIGNALGASGLAHSLDVEFEAIEAGLRVFDGVERRFEKKGEIGDILVVDDYAHHPAEIAATLATARDTGRRVVAVFQPHLYSRTRDFLEDFARALQAADQVFLTDIYGSREEPLPEIHTGLIARAMQEQGYGQVEYIPCVNEVSAHLLEACRTGDLVVTLGAGDIGQVADELLAALSIRAG